jgi:hypothetical protein
MMELTMLMLFLFMVHPLLKWSSCNCAAQLTAVFVPMHLPLLHPYGISTWHGTSSKAFTPVFHLLYSLNPPSGSPEPQWRVFQTTDVVINTAI